MKSTPAVLCAPALSAKSTPCISMPMAFHHEVARSPPRVATPAVFQRESYPWAVKTPEPSPMCWGVAPCATSLGGMSQNNVEEPVISRELLRTVCEPFFEQMLTALQQALQHQQKRQNSEEVHMPQARACASRGTPSLATFHPLDPMLDEESTEADDTGAFASLLAGSSSDGEGSDSADNLVSPSGTVPEEESVDAEVSLVKESIPAPPRQPPLEDSEQAADAAKSTMVCRHWKSKGWCRLESKCKFMHPEHKRGVGLGKTSGGGETGGAISRAPEPGMSTILNLSAALAPAVEVPAPSAARRKKSEGINGSHACKQFQLQEPVQE